MLFQALFPEITGIVSLSCQEINIFWVRGKLEEITTTYRGKETTGNITIDKAQRMLWLPTPCIQWFRLVAMLFPLHHSSLHSSMT